jgi:hypothetical protein
MIFDTTKIVVQHVLEAERSHFDSKNQTNKSKKKLFHLLSLESQVLRNYYFLFYSDPLFDSAPKENLFSLKTEIFFTITQHIYTYTIFETRKEIKS